ncbi:hypothetical protein ASF27_14570 [Methylobacterium sp. Leaf102]|nr:hypothetical protein ASF27_14570 [Methylobacterium sp. Leaf102]
MFMSLRGRGAGRVPKTVATDRNGWRWFPLVGVPSFPAPDGYRREAAEFTPGDSKRRRRQNVMARIIAGNRAGRPRP